MRPCALCLDSDRPDGGPSETKSARRAANALRTSGRPITTGLAPALMPARSMRLWPLLSMEIASACLSVLIPAPLQSLHFVFWCNAEPAESKDGCAHRYVRRGLGHGSLAAGAQHGGCGGPNATRLANVLQHAVEAISEGKQLVPGHLGSPLSTQRLDHLRKPRPLSIACWHSAASLSVGHNGLPLSCGGQTELLRSTKRLGCPPSYRAVC